MEAAEVLRVIGECTAQVLPGLAQHRFERSDRLAELGADSVERAEILIAVLERLSLQLPRTEMFGPRNLGELADLLTERLRHG